MCPPFTPQGRAPTPHTSASHTYKPYAMIFNLDTTTFTPTLIEQAIGSSARGLLFTVLIVFCFLRDCGMNNILSFSASSPSPGLMASPLSYDSTTTYVDLIRLIKPYLSALQPSYPSGPPELLPVDVHDFLKLCLGMNDDVAKLAWERLRNTAWSHDLTSAEELAARTKHINLFLQYGLTRKIGLSGCKYIYLLLLTYSVVRCILLRATDSGLHRPDLCSEPPGGPLHPARTRTGRALDGLSDFIHQGVWKCSWFCNFSVLPS